MAISNSYVILQNSIFIVRDPLIIASPIFFLKISIFSLNSKEKISLRNSVMKSNKFNVHPFVCTSNEFLKIYLLSPSKVKSPPNFALVVTLIGPTF